MILVQYECQLTEVLYRAQIGGWSLAHRAVATKSPEYFLSTHRHLFERHDEKFGAEKTKDGDAVYESNDIISFHNLVTHDKSAQKQAPGSETNIAGVCVKNCKIFNNWEEDCNNYTLVVTFKK